MSLARVLSADEAARLIPDRAVVAISSSSGLNTPDRVIRAIGERFAREGRPQNLTTLHPIGTGDMYGIKGIDHLARPGLLRRVIAGSYPSGPSSLPSPDIWRMIQEDAVEAYNLPSGLIFDMLRDVAAKRAGRADQGRARHLRRSAPRGRQDEPGGARTTSSGWSSSTARSGCTSRTSRPTSRSSAARPRTRGATSRWSTRRRRSARWTWRSPRATAAAW